MALDLAYGTVTGTFMQTVIDSADAGRDPDLIPMTGTVVFTPDVKYFKIEGETVAPQPISCDLLAGVLTAPDGLAGIKLVASDNSLMNPRDWTYTVKFSIVGGAGAVAIPAVSFALLGGSTVDLTDLVSVAATAGTPTISGPAGPDTPGAPIYFYWGSGHYNPSALLGNTDRNKIFVGPTDPTTQLGTVMGLGDLWLQTS